MRKFHFDWLLALLLAPMVASAQDNKPASPSSAGTGDSAQGAPSQGIPAASFKSFKEAYAAGNDALKNRKFEEAVADYGAAEDLASGDKAKSQAANAQGWAYLKGRKLEAAKRAFARSIEENGDNKLALKNLGAVEYDLYQYGTGTVDDLKESVKNLEASGENQEDLESAKAALTREEGQAQATPPAEADTAGLNLKALLDLSDKLEEEGQIDQALKVLEKAGTMARSHSGRAAAANRRGKLLLDARRPTKAEPYFEEAVENQPKNKVYLNNLGWNNWVLYQSGSAGDAGLKKAVDAFYQMNSIDPSYHVENLKMALDELKDVDPEAAKAYTVKDESASDTDKTDNAKDDGSPNDSNSNSN